MVRHLLTHKQEVKGRRTAVAICKGLKKFEKDSLKKPVNEEMEIVWGDLLQDPDIREKVKKTCLVAGVYFQDDATAADLPPTGTVHRNDSSDSSSSSSESEEEDDQGEPSTTVHARKKEMRLNLHVDPKHVVLVEFEAAYKKKSKSTDNVKKSVERLSPFLAFAEMENPLCTDYMAVVNKEAAKQYLKANKKAGVSNATRLTYAKTVVTLLELMKSRKSKMPSVPWDTPGFEN